MSPSSTSRSLYLDRLEFWLSSVEVPDETTLVDDLERIAEDRPETRIAWGWMLAKASPHVEVIRSFSFLLTTNEYGRREDRIGALLDLISDLQSREDPSTIINLITAVRQIMADCELGLSNLIGLALPALIKAAIQSVPLAAEAAIDFLVEIDNEGLSSQVFGPIERTAIINTQLKRNPSQSELHVEELGKVQDRLGRIRKKAGTEFEFSPLVRFQEALRRLRQDENIADKPWTGLVDKLIHAYNDNLRTWGLLANARRLDTPVHQLRVMEQNGDTPNFDVVSRIVQLWQIFVNSLNAAGAREIGFRPFATSNGSFVLSLAATSTPSALKKVLTGPKELTLGLSVSSDSEIPPAWFDLCTLLANEKIRLEFSIADPQAETFHVSRAIEPKERPLSPASRKKTRWKWDLNSIDVPQADSIERVFRLTELVSRGLEPTADNLDVDPRQVAYYRRAAISLRLLAESGQLTAAGDRLVSLNHVGRLSLSAVLFETSACGGAWTEWAEAATLAEVDPDTAKQFLTETVAGLSDVTALRRSKTLSAWHRVLMPYHYSTLNLTRKAKK